jgi:hypothetical protein
MSPPENQRQSTYREPGAFRSQPKVEKVQKNPTQEVSTGLPVRACTKKAAEKRLGEM